MTHNCEQYRNRLASMNYEHADWSTLETQAASCDECRDALATIRRLRDDAASFDYRLGRDRLAVLKAQARSRRSHRLLAVAALICVLLLAGIVVLRSRRQPEEAVADARPQPVSVEDVLQREPMAAKLATLARREPDTETLDWGLESTDLEFLEDKKDDNRIHRLRSRLRRLRNDLNDRS